MRRIQLSALASLVLVISACSNDYLVGRPPYFAASIDVIDFGEVAIGETETRSVFLINKGEMPMELYPPDGALLGDLFSLVGMEESVEAGGSVTVRVFFTPQSEGPIEAEITFPNDSANLPDFALTVKGSGVERDPCAGVVCNTPPRYCIDNDTSAGFEPVGECIEGKCQYTEREPKDCPDYGCDEDTGRCAGDPCLGVTCTTPPNGCYFAQGACDRGACVYEPNDGISCDDGSQCTDNAKCSQGTCSGTPRSCTQPSAPECADANTLRQFNPVGHCNKTSGDCVFSEPILTTCAHGCEPVTINGVTQDGCKGDPCATIPPDFNSNDPCKKPRCDASTNNKWVWDFKDGASCTANSSACSVGICHAGVCGSKAGVTCEVTTDKCFYNVKYTGTCLEDGKCAMDQNGSCWDNCSKPNALFCISCGFPLGDICY